MDLEVQMEEEPSTADLAATASPMISEMPYNSLTDGQGALETYEEAPPQLEVDDRGDDKTSSDSRRHVILDEAGNDITDRPEVQALIASGEIEFNEGEQIVLVDQTPTHTL